MPTTFPSTDTALQLMPRSALHLPEGTAVAQTPQIKALAMMIEELHRRGGGLSGTGILAPIQIDADNAVVAGKDAFAASEVLGEDAPLPVIRMEGGALARVLQLLPEAQSSPVAFGWALAAWIEADGLTYPQAATQLGRSPFFIQQFTEVARAKPDALALLGMHVDTLSVVRLVDMVEDADLRACCIQLALCRANRAALEVISRAETIQPARARMRLMREMYRQIGDGVPPQKVAEWLKAATADADATFVRRSKRMGSKDRPRFGQRSGAKPKNRTIRHAQEK